MYETLFVPILIFALVGFLGFVVGVGLSDRRKAPPAEE